MKKKIILLTLSLAVVTTGVVLSLTFLSGGESDKMDIVDKSLEVSDAVISLYRGENKLEELKQENEGHFEEEVFKNYEEYLTSLEETNENKVNITQFYLSGEMDKNPDPIGEAAEEAGVTSLFEVAGDEPEQEGEAEVDHFELENDPRLFLEGNEHFIRVNDLDLSQGQDIVPYEGINLPIYKELVDVTYDMMVEDPSYHYNYVTYMESTEGSQDYVDILYTSITDDTNSIIVRVFNNKKTIIGFEVRQ